MVKSNRGDTMIYLASFIIFMIFVGCMAIGFIIQRKKLLSENEANDILEGLTCASCRTSSCSFAGQNRKSAKNCQATMSIPAKNI